jgi:hypothetical protein
MKICNIIEMSCKKLDGYSYQTMSAHPIGTWNDETGYGLVDAQAAVQAATCTTSLVNQTISSNRFVRRCNNLSLSILNVTVASNAKLTVKSNGTSISGTFQVQSGSVFEIR